METICKGCGQAFGCDVDKIRGHDDLGVDVDNTALQDKDLQNIDSQSSKRVCWCMTRTRIKELPPLPIDLNFKHASCYCETCLNKQTGSRLAHLYQQHTLPELLAIAKRYRNENPHSVALVEHIDFTIEKGFHVFSRWFHLKRGTCCGNGCKHCPYGSAD
ncbi:DUF5522 domain-containing protein [Algibacillus agarilyticus]|uniref:DUF5522 domain-containing protein n=1 Tax=Algibacillus agarilyticus TaxID=2234133 RepID=UPI001E3A8BD3|nr:DUF5522 domain-containing protein [Algibacillus agarilyticus]